ncbi:adenosylcobinamide-GDP ribazoletransferase [Agrobacterium sp.]|jgi:adenosylcobinamide-GDP ribazoletransferase|uniref:adenosylcobinamide-GDP ribazoletransferase n=1 Tax=Agrobacterium sp. TaxID=361 RepID=UPI0028ADA64E
MDINAFITDLARAVGFLGRFPVPQHFFDGYDGKMVRLSRTFAFAGLLIALPAALVLLILLSLDAKPLLASMITLAVMVFSTGALHEDGFADTADGLGSGRTGDRIIEIMKDSRLGTYGSVALFFSFGLRAAALMTLGDTLTPVGAAAVFLGAAALSRGLMVWHWTATPSARQQGLASSAGQPDSAARNTAVISGVVIASVLALPFVSIFALTLAFAAVAVAITVFNGFVVKKINGHTGDTIGATQQISVIVLLCTLALTN